MKEEFMEKSTAQRLRENHEEILSRWQKRAYQEVKATTGQTSLVLQNGISSFLKEIENALINQSRLSTARLKVSCSFGSAHGIGRAATVNYSIDQVIYEYHILREVLFEVLEVSAPLEKVERDIIITMIEGAVNLSATNFSDALRNVREQLVSLMAHDLKTPVTSVLLGAEMILKRTSDVEFCKRTAINIITGMHRLERMITDLLDASRIGAGERIEVKLGVFDLRLLVSEVVANCNLVYGNRFILPAGGPIEGRWDFEGVRRVLENLTNNAAKYSYPRTPITITVKEIQDRVRISIHNESDPISAEQQKIIFQQHRRLRNTKDQQGWGLGLLLARGIVEAHGGQITLKSNREEGTTFTVELPLLAKVEGNITSASDAAQPDEKPRKVG